MNPNLFVCQAVSFKKSSRGLARSLWLKNIKITVILIVVVIVSMIGVNAGQTKIFSFSGRNIEKINVRKGIFYGRFIKGNNSVDVQYLNQIF